MAPDKVKQENNGILSDADKVKGLAIMMNPKSVAIVGASQNPDKVGHVILQNYLDVGYSGKLYPVNANAAGKILGLESYRNITEIKKPIDLAVIAIPAKFTSELITECHKAGVKSIVVVSSGYAEIGEVKLEQELIDLANKYKIPLLGPNCLGVMDLKSRVDTLFLPTFKIDRPSIGGVSFVSQSGAVGSSTLDIIANEGFGLSKFISYGNASVIDETDILNYLAKDEDTKVILYYIEGVKRGRAFIEAAKKATLKKPIVVLKGGRTEAGSKAAHSHTASLAGSYEAYDAVFRQFGLIRADDIQDFVSFSKIFVSQPKCTGNRIAIMTNGGGVGVVGTDSLYSNGLQLAELSEESKKALKKALPPIVGVNMPIDMAGDADDKRFSATLDIISKDPNIDAIMAITLFQTPGADSRVASTLIHYGTTMEKPMVVVSIGGSYTGVHKMMMERSGIPVYDSPNTASRALAALISYSKYLHRMGK